ncbi:MAG: phosphoglycolate phosphatase [Bryobacteraceae bacterium]
MELLIFDLDGTLIDSKLDLAHAVNAALAYMSLPPLDNAVVSSYVGNGAPILIRRALAEHATEANEKKALDYFLAYYDQHNLDNTCAYPDVQEALAELQAAGVKMAVLTNKPVRVSGRILEGLGLAKYFVRIYGGNSFETKKPNPAGAEKLIEELEVKRDAAMMVGDSAVDVLTARNAGIKVCGVRYGFQPDTFEQDPPDMIVDRLTELAHAIIQERGQRGALKR